MVATEAIFVSRREKLNQLPKAAEIWPLPLFLYQEQVRTTVRYDTIQDSVLYENRDKPFSSAC
jgi:hypothetical protein